MMKMLYKKKGIIGDRRGRPPILNDPVRMHIYLERAERDELHRIADERGWTVSTLVRGIIMKTLKKMRQ